MEDHLAPTPTDPDGWTRWTEPLSAWGASPVWRGIEDRLYWADPGLKRVNRLHLPTGRVDHWDLGQPVVALVPCRQGGWLIVLPDGVHHSPQWQMPLTLLARAPFDPRLQRFAAAVCDPWGRLWLGSHCDVACPGEAALYCLRARDRQHPELAMARAGVGGTQALAFHADGRQLVRADLLGGAVEVLPLRSAGRWPVELGLPQPLWRATPRPAGWRFEDALGRDWGGRPAAVALDNAGRCWVAMHEGGRVLCLSPGGQLLAELVLPAQCPTGLCFGGRDLRTLFVTTARQHRSAAELAHYPDSGAVFARPVAVTGLPPAVYWD